MTALAGTAPRERKVAHLFDWIWTVVGKVPLAPGQSRDEAFARLDPLFRARGTSFERRGDTLTFRKENQAPQDRLAVFDKGTLQIEPEASGAVLRYRMASRFLLFSFLAPFLFLGFAALTIGVGELEGPPTAEEIKKEEEKMNRVLPQHPIDKFLGAPAPEKPKMDDKAKDEGKAENKGPKPTSAFVLAAIFALLYGIGRFLEAWLAKSLFRKSLQAD